MHAPPLSEHGCIRDLVITLNRYNDVLSLIAYSDDIGVVPRSRSPTHWNSERGELHKRNPYPQAVRSLEMTWRQCHGTLLAHMGCARRSLMLFDHLFSEG